MRVAGMYGVLSDTMLYSLETPPPFPPHIDFFYFEYSLTFFVFLLLLALVAYTDLAPSCGGKYFTLFCVYNA